MERTKEFIHYLTEYIQDYIKEHSDEMDEERYMYVVQMCSGFNEICETLEYIEKHRDNHSKKYNNEELYTTTNESEWLINNIENELTAAKRYYNKWLDTKEQQYKIIAKDELRHAESFINQAQQKTMDQRDKEIVQQQIENYKMLNKDLSC